MWSPLITPSGTMLQLQVEIGWLELRISYQFLSGLCVLCRYFQRFWVGDFCWQAISFNLRHQSYPYELSQSLFYGFCDVAKVVIIQKIILIFGKTFRINNINKSNHHLICFISNKGLDGNVNGLLLQGLKAETLIKLPMWSLVFVGYKNQHYMYVKW